MTCRLLRWPRRCGGGPRLVRFPVTRICPTTRRPLRRSPRCGGGPRFRRWKRIYPTTCRPLRLSRRCVGGPRLIRFLTCWSWKRIVGENHKAWLNFFLIRECLFIVNLNKRSEKYSKRETPRSQARAKRETFTTKDTQISGREKRNKQTHSEGPCQGGSDRIEFSVLRRLTKKPKK